jgi:uncharacterized protein YacL
MIKNISNFNNLNDYLPIITSALIIDMFVLSRVVFGYIKIKSLNEWYNKFGFLAVVADVLSIVIGIIIARYLYPIIFSNYSLILFIVLTCFIQIIHDLSFAYFFYIVPRNKSRILDVFKDYGKEVGLTILLADSLMIIGTILLSSYITSFTINIQIIVLIVSLYILPYLLYSIPA